MNLKRKIREELNKTLLREDSKCAASVKIWCWALGSRMVGSSCVAALMSGDGSANDPCMYENCCAGVNQVQGDKAQTKG